MKDTRPSGKQYAAFISYGHASNEEIAAAVENGLKRLAKPWNRLRALEVFRDRSSLAAGPALDVGP
uniref:hypothetical protein n=1 Tax=Paractinoplanes polyasparticus TaxID=2856853 RepID=UPI001C8470FA|nr:hypothetical protein [Actinoplanes polyasparticus]